MGRSRNAGKQIPPFVGDFLRQMPPAAVTEVETLAEPLPVADPVAALARCSDEEIRAALAIHPPRLIAESLGRIGVNARGAQPRHIGQMRLRLSQGLRIQERGAVWLAHMLAEPTYKLLVARGTGLVDEVPAHRINPAVDTPPLRALAVAVALRLPDPSAPVVLAGMLRTDDPALPLLFSADEITDLRDRAEKLRADWQDDWTGPLQEWARSRCHLAAESPAATPTSERATIEHTAQPRERTAPRSRQGAGSSGAQDVPAEAVSQQEPAGPTASPVPVLPPAVAPTQSTTTPDDPASDLAVLADTYPDVAAGAQEVLAAITARRPARSDHLAAITRWSTALRTAAAQLGAEAGTDLDVLQTLEQQGRTDQLRRDRLAELRALSGPAALHDALTALASLVDQLTGSWPLVSADDPTAQALLGLRDLVLAAASDTRDDDELLELALTLKQALPVPVNRLASAAALGRLALRGGEHDERTHGDAGSAAADVQSDPLAHPDSAPATAGATSGPAGPGSRTEDGRGPALGDATDDAGGSPRTSAPAADAGPEEPAATTAVAHVPGHDDPAAEQPTTAPVPDNPPTLPTRAATDLPGTRLSPRAPAEPAAPPAAAIVADAARTTTAATDHLDVHLAADPTVAASIVATVDRLLIEGRLGLAYEILQAASAYTHADVVELAALAAALQGGGGPSGLYMCAMLEAVTDDDLHSDSACALMSTVALVTAAVVAGSERAGQLLAGVAPHLDAAWARLARLTAEAAATGALTGPALAARDTRAQSLTGEAAAAAADRLGSTFTLRTPRSTGVLAQLRAPEATIGRALRAAADNDFRHAAQLAHELTALDEDGLVEAAREADRSNRVNGRSLPSADLDEITGTLLADRAAVLRWAETATDRGGTDWTADRLAELREHLLGHGDDLHAALATHRDCALSEGAAAVARRGLQKLQAVVAGATSPQVEPTPDTVLHLESLKAAGTRYDVSTGEVLLDPDRDRDSDDLIQALLAAADSDFTVAVRRCIDEDDFATALRCAEEVGPDAAEEVRATEARRAQQLLADLQQERLLAVRARSGPAGAIEQDLLEAQLKQAELVLQGPDRDIRAAAVALADVREQMGMLHEQAVRTLRTQIDDLDRQQLLRPEERVQLLAKLDRGEFDAVEYELFYLGNNEPVPDEGTNILSAFFPAAVTALRGGLTADLIKQLDDGQTVGPITPPTGQDHRHEVARALTAWTRLPEALRSGQDRDRIRELLSPALRALGFDVNLRSVQSLDVDNARGRGRLLLGLAARPTGRVMIPAFGSLADGRYRLLLAWDSPTVDQLTDWRELDATGGAPLIICYFGTLSVDERMRLSREWNDPAKRSAIIVDDAVLAFTAATTRDTFSTLMHVTMPFSATAPYSTEKTARVPLEMFYGREHARRDIIRLDGPSMIFGGRGMGKSALLSVIQRRARANPSEHLTVVWIELERSPEFDEPEMIWVKLADALQAEGVSSSARGLAQMRPENRVERLVGDFLSANPDTQLLLLIDEADAFFSADARREFRQTSRLLKLANSTTRCKVVFAGLHGVAHHHGVGNNPFSPSGALPIGPLDRGDAYRLLIRPLRTLGYEIGMDEANLVLMHCNNQPYLIQLFAARLTDRLLRSRGRTDVPLPRPVPPELIEAVRSDGQLREQIHRAFKITLDLDPRFSIIVHLLAQYAYAHGQVPLGEADLLEQCRLAWPAGFADTSFAAFRELLNELEALGMLGPPEPTRGGRTLRSTAVLESLGSREHIELTLQEINATALPEADARLQFRPSIGEEGRPGPLTSAQLADLAGRPGNRVRIVVGTELSGLSQVLESLQNPVHKPVLRDVRVTPTKSDFRELLRAGNKSERRLTIVSPLHEKVTASAPCQTALLTAEQLLPSEPDHFRAVVLTCGPSNADWLWEVAMRPDIDSLVVPLERFDASTLKLHWRDTSSKVRPLGAELADRTLRLTGGWSALVDEVAVRARRVGAERALDELEEQQSQPHWPGLLLARAGVLLDPADDAGVAEGRLLRVLRLVDDYGPCSLTDLREVAGEEAVDDASITLAAWFGVVAVDPGGQASLAPLIGHAWRTWAAQRGALVAPIG